MDPLSQLLSLLKPISYITAGFDAGGAWSLVLDDLAGRIKCYAVVRGECWLSLDGDAAPVRLSEGDCFVLPTGRSATIGSDSQLVPQRASEVLDPNRSGDVVTYNGGGDTYLVGSRFEVSGRHADLLLSRLPPMIRIEGAGGQTRLRWCIDLMMEEMREKCPGFELLAQQLAQMILIQALRLYLATQTETDTGWLAGLADPRIATALAAIHMEPAFSWTVEELARRSAMSRSTFSHLFAAKVGETPIAYLTRWRMMLAAERLIGSGETIAGVAQSVGYVSEHAFNHAFRRTMGTSPRRYARESRRA
ncbi:AraC family transcriptional regulator [Sphingobium scionense]|uniref:AraC-like DNA-binding protein n=1 Tax=Sphingobium scionense TaxID=1404341 RepID=A0A7W6PWZ5_9SPHN|nr:AraC family transcriptional regulator [Sphingobium scionense]MBB4149699.1 AraC-like DNA-binding protein [Sphingobium scionense]